MFIDFVIYSLLRSCLCSLAGCWSEACNRFSCEIWGEIGEGTWSRALFSLSQIYILSPTKSSKATISGTTIPYRNQWVSPKSETNSKPQQNRCRFPHQKSPYHENEGTQIISSWNFLGQGYHRVWYMIFQFLIQSVLWIDFSPFICSWCMSSWALFLEFTSML